MIKKPKLIDWIICDDVRTEVGEKLTMVGVYSKDIIVPMIPLLLPQLYLVTKWDISGGHFEEISFRLESPDGGQLGPVPAKVPKDIKGGIFTMNLAMIPFQIQKVGTFRIFLKIDDESEKKIGEFEVKLASSAP